MSNARKRLAEKVYFHANSKVQSALLDAMSNASWFKLFGCEARISFWLAVEYLAERSAR